MVDFAGILTVDSVAFPVHCSIFSSLKTFCKHFDHNDQEITKFSLFKESRSLEKQST